MKGVHSVCIVCNVEFTNRFNEEQESKLPNSCLVKLWHVFCNYFHVQPCKFEDILKYFCSVAELPFCNGSCRNDVAELFILHEKLGHIQNKIKNLTTTISAKIVESTENKNKTQVEDKPHVNTETIFDSILCDEQVNQRIYEMRREIAQYYKPKVVLVNTCENEMTKSNKHETSNKNSLVINESDSRDSSKSVLEAITSSKKVVTTEEEDDEKEKDEEETLNLSTDSLLRRLLFKSSSADSKPVDKINSSSDSDSENKSNVIKRVGEKSFLFYKEWLVFLKNSPPDQWKWTDPKALFCCATCQAEFRGTEAMRNHIYHSHHHNNSSCVDDYSPEKTTINAQNPNSHQLPTFPTPSPFKCHVSNCGSRFVNMSSFFQHLQQSHNIQKKVWLDKPSNPKETERNRCSNPTNLRESDDDNDDDDDEDEYNDNYDDSNDVMEEIETEQESDFSMETEVDPLALDTEQQIVKHESNSESGSEFPPVPPENIIFEATLENPDLLTQKSKQHHHTSFSSSKMAKQQKLQRILPRLPIQHFKTNTITSTTTTNLLPTQVPSSSAIAITPMGVLLQNINHIPCSSSVLTLSSIPQLILNQNQNNHFQSNNFQNDSFQNDNFQNNNFQNDNYSSNNRILDLSRKRKGDPKEDQRKRRSVERNVLEELKTLILPQFPRLESDNCRIAHILVDARKHIDVLRENEIRLKNEKQRLLHKNTELLKLKDKYEYS